MPTLINGTGRIINVSKKLPTFVEFVPEKAFRSFVVLILPTRPAPPTRGGATEILFKTLLLRVLIVTVLYLIGTVIETLFLYNTETKLPQKRAHIQCCLQRLMPFSRRVYNMFHHFVFKPEVVIFQKGLS